MLASLLLAVPISAAALPQAQDPAEEFRSQYRAALELNDKQAIDGLLRKYKTPAITEFISNADALSEGGGGLGAWVEAFTESWQRVYRSSFARNYSRYLGLMNESTRRNRSEILRVHYPLLLKMHAEALGEKTEKAWIPVREDAPKVVDAMRQTGDLYYLSVLLYCQGNAYNTDLTDGDGASDERALEIYQDYLKVREQLDLTNDQDYDTVKNLAAEMRAKLGLPDPTTGVVGERKISRFEVQPLEGAEWSEVELAFEIEEKPLEVQHANDMADDHRLSWKLAGTREVGTEAVLDPFDPPVVVRRVAFGKFVIDGGAGPSEEFKLTPKPEIVPFKRKLVDGRVVDHAMMVAGGTDRDMFHGAELNLSVNDNFSTVFYRSVASMTGDTPFGPVTLYDHNGDGAFGYASLAVSGARGFPTDTWVYRYDSVLVGKGKHSQPFSRFVTDGKGAWFELQVEDYFNPTKLKLLPVAPKTGQLKVSMKGLKGLKLVSLVLSAETSQIRGAMVDLMVGKGGALELPIGRYKLQQGLLRGSKGAESILLPGSGLGTTFDVEEGSTETIELGAPFSFQVERRLEGNLLILDGNTFCITGRSGERYLRMVGEPPFGVLVTLKGEKAEGEMRGSTADEIMKDWNLAYLPQSLELELKKAEMPPMRLVLKKHPWFGKIDSGWLE